jgi:hypothetical protein
VSEFKPVPNEGRTFVITTCVCGVCDMMLINAYCILMRKQSTKDFVSYPVLGVSKTIKVSQPE